MPSRTSDSFLRCSACGRESTANFASSLRDGWEKCCGYTMTLVRTDADIDAAVGEVFEPDPELTKTMRQFFREGDQ